MREQLSLRGRLPTEQVLICRFSRAASIRIMELRWACSAAGRAPALQAGGRRFDPGHVHQSIQQLSERRPVEFGPCPHECPHGRVSSPFCPAESGTAQRHGCSRHAIRSPGSFRAVWAVQPCASFASVWRQPWRERRVRCGRLRFYVASGPVGCYRRKQLGQGGVTSIEPGTKEGRVEPEIPVASRVLPLAVSWPAHVSVEAGWLRF